MKGDVILELAQPIGLLIISVAFLVSSFAFVALIGKGNTVNQQAVLLSAQIIGNAMVIAGFGMVAFAIGTIWSNFSRPHSSYDHRRTCAVIGCTGKDIDGVFCRFHAHDIETQREARRIMEMYPK